MVARSTTSSRPAMSATTISSSGLWTASSRDPSHADSFRRRARRAAGGRRSRRCLHVLRRDDLVCGGASRGGAWCPGDLARQRGLFPDRHGTGARCRTVRRGRQSNCPRRRSTRPRRRPCSGASCGLGGDRGRHGGRVAAADRGEHRPRPRGAGRRRLGRGDRGRARAHRGRGRLCDRGLRWGARPTPTRPTVSSPRSRPTVSLFRSATYRTYAQGRPRRRCGPDSRAYPGCPSFSSRCVPACQRRHAARR